MYTLFHFRCIFRWFTHYYILATVVTSICVVLSIECYVFEMPPPGFLREFLVRLRVSEKSALLTLMLLWLHVVRRLFESLFVSVYSDTKMNIMHYSLGLLHYLCLPCAVLVEAPGFVSNLINLDSTLKQLSFLQLLGILLFAISNISQHQSLDVLANMRRNYLGNITNYAHGIPTSGWFEVVSCPHFLFEVLIYLSLWCTIGPLARVWPSVCLFVFVNQCIAAKITHNWYQEKFGDMYPAHRRAIFPYLF
ncbi:unnamed protein product [Soboliphyme baturini]|uniref:Polyprenal reductase n=1 Tax=Soboliphyme baturini TaxID=241478 RepID=A0A3P8DEA7_9BILA|nr:unnamed protein product [Soboliphyme baturini]